MELRGRLDTAVSKCLGQRLMDNVEEMHVRCCHYAQAVDFGDAMDAIFTGRILYLLCVLRSNNYQTFTRSEHDRVVSAPVQIVGVQAESGQRVLAVFHRVVENEDLARRERVCIHSQHAPVRIHRDILHLPKVNVHLFIVAVDACQVAWVALFLQNVDAFIGIGNEQSNDL